MTDQDILNMPGVVVRKMPTEVVSRWMHYVTYNNFTQRTVH